MHKCPLTDIHIKSACPVSTCIYWTEVTSTNCCGDIENLDDAKVRRYRQISSGRKLELERGAARNELERMIILDKYYEHLVEEFPHRAAGVKLVLEYPLDYPGHRWTTDLYESARSRSVFKGFKKKHGLVGVKLEALLGVKATKLTR
jgi:hypothetical protein